MSTTQVLPKRHLDQILEESISQQRRIVLTHHSPQGWRMFKSKFVAGSAESQVLVVDQPVPRESVDVPLPAPGDQLGVTFRAGHKKCMFGTTLDSFQRRDGESVAALQWPRHLQQIRRRAYERAEVPTGTVIAVRFWREDPGPGTGVEARTVHHGQMENLSAGGMRVRIAGARDIEIGAIYRCAFAARPGKPPLLLDVLVRHREAVGQGRASIGLQFVGLEATPEGRRTLERLARTVGQLQRARAHRKR